MDIFPNYSNLYNLFLSDAEKPDEINELMLKELERLGLTLDELTKAHDTLRFEPLKTIELSTMEKYLNAFNFYQFETLDLMNVRTLRLHRSKSNT